MTTRTRVTATVDFDKSGKQAGMLRIPYSQDRDAYGNVPVPLMVMKNGEGPTVILTGANHGDEVDGSVVIMEMMLNVDPLKLNGRLILIPGLNFPAYLNATRTSPLDGGNLNRLFPGDPDGTPTQMLADYIATVLMPMADYVLDFHAGGTTMSYLPTLFLSRPSSEAEARQAESIISAFGAERMMFMDGLASEQMIGSVARKHGAYLVTGEFGGGGGVNLEGVAAIRRGIAGVLDMLGVLRAETLLVPAKTHRYRFRTEHYAFAHVPGIFEPACRLGDRIVAGQLAGLIHDPYRPWVEPEPVRFVSDGQVFCLRSMARVEAGNFLAHLAEEDI